EAEQDAGYDEPGQDKPGGEAHLRRIGYESDPKIGAERVKGPAGEIDDFLNAENELQSGGNQEQYRGVKHAADQDVRKSRHQRDCRSDLKLRGLDPVPKIRAGRLLQV